MAPWRDAVGFNVSEVTEGEPDVELRSGGHPCRWSVAIEFRGLGTIWLAAANYLEPEGYLLPWGTN